MSNDKQIDFDTDRKQRESNGIPKMPGFKDKLQDLQKVLEPTDIDFRIGRTGLKENYGWCTLLAYKDSRVDMKRLDDVFGGEWSNTFHRDGKGVLQCEISIYNADLKQWVSRASNGMPSNFESEKGEYSDALKRAGFMWGIGRELYDFPDLFLKFHNDEFWVENPEAKKPKVNPTYKFKPSEWEWKVDWEHEDEMGKQTGLIWAKEKGSTNYRIKPTRLIEPHKL